jgi:large subunit ribosomal protein L21
VYAVIQTGGKQYRVAEGERLAVERVSPPGGGEEEGAGDLSFTPILLVDGASVTATPADLAGASVSARVVGEEKGPKIRGFTYKNKTNSRRRWGHRQKYTTIEITGITTGSTGTTDTTSTTDTTETTEGEG